jgi:hypothetical protein
VETAASAVPPSAARCGFISERTAASGPGWPFKRRACERKWNAARKKVTTEIRDHAEGRATLMRAPTLEPATLGEGARELHCHAEL